MKNNDWLFILGALLVIIGVLSKIIDYSFAPYITGVGAIIVFAFRMFFSVKSNDFKIKRLTRIQFISSCLLIIGSYLMYSNNPPNSWALALFLAAALDIIVMWRMPAETQK